MKNTLLDPSSCADKKTSDENTSNNSIQPSPILQEDSISYGLMQWQMHRIIIDKIRWEDIRNEYACNDNSLLTKDNDQNKDLHPNDEKEIDVIDVIDNMREIETI